MGSTTHTTATSFAAIGRILSDAAKAHGVEGPSFRSPPRIPGVRRSVTRNRDGSVTVALAVRDRPLMAVVGDMIDGIILTSGTDRTANQALHDHLWSSAEQWLVNRLTGEPTGQPHLRVA